MKTRILTICLAVLLVAAGYVWGNRSVVHAQGASAVVPKAWGHAVGVEPNAGLFFEDSDGVVRFVNSYNGHLLRQLNRQ